MKLRQLEWRVRQRVGTAVEDDGWESPAEVAEAINDAFQELADLHVWPWLIDTWTVDTDGSRTVELPGEVAKILHVAVPAHDRALMQRPSARLADDRHGGEGVPREYAVDGGELVLRPKPRSGIELEIRGVRMPDRLDYDDEPPFHETFHPILMYEAAADIVDSRPGEQDPRSERWRERSARLIGRMQAHYRSSYDQQPTIVGGRDHRRPNMRAGGGRKREVW